LSIVAASSIQVGSSYGRCALSLLERTSSPCFGFSNTSHRLTPAWRFKRGSATRETRWLTVTACVKSHIVFAAVIHKDARKSGRKEKAMKYIFCVALLSAVSFGALAQTGGGGQQTSGRAAVEACLTKCSNDDSSCRRVCPITFSGPCLSSCDSRAQSCRQSCQAR
jgi:hypothetical protein